MPACGRRCGVGQAELLQREQVDRPAGRLQMIPLHVQVDRRRAERAVAGNLLDRWQIDPRLQQFRGRPNGSRGRKCSRPSVVPYRKRSAHTHWLNVLQLTFRSCKRWSWYSRTCSGVRSAGDRPKCAANRATCDTYDSTVRGERLRNCRSSMYRCRKGVVTGSRRRRRTRGRTPPPSILTERTTARQPKKPAQPLPSDLPAPSPTRTSRPRETATPGPPHTTAERFSSTPRLSCRGRLQGR